MRLNLRVGLLDSLRHLCLCNPYCQNACAEASLWFNPFWSDMSISSCPLSDDNDVSQETWRSGTPSNASCLTENNGVFSNNLGNAIKTSSCHCNTQGCRRSGIVFVYVLLHTPMVNEAHGLPSWMFTCNASPRDKTTTPRSKS